MRLKVLVAILIALLLTPGVALAISPWQSFLNWIRGSESVTLSQVTTYSYEFGSFTGPDEGYPVVSVIVLGDFRIAITWYPIYNYVQTHGIQTVNGRVYLSGLVNLMGSTPYIKYEVYYKGSLVRSGTLYKYQQVSGDVTGDFADFSWSIQTMGEKNAGGIPFVDVFVFIQSWYYGTVTPTSGGFKVSNFPSGKEYTSRIVEIQPSVPTYYVNGVQKDDPDGVYSGTSIKIELRHPSDWNIGSGVAYYNKGFISKNYKITAKITQKDGVIYEKQQAEPTAKIEISTIVPLTFVTAGAAIFAYALLRRSS